MKKKQVLLAAVDFSPPSNTALDTAVALAKQLDADLHIVHALELPTPVFSTYSFQIPEYYLDSARTESARLLESAAKHASENGVEARCHLAHQPASTAIAEMADEVGADLIVIGTHGHTGLRHVALGSVAERTVRHAKCNVLVVKDRSTGVAPRAGADS